MKAIQIIVNDNWLGIEFCRDLFLTDEDVRNIIKLKPDKYQGYYTRISKVSELHTKQLITLAKNYNKDWIFRIYNI